MPAGLAKIHLLFSLIHIDEIALECLSQRFIVAFLQQFETGSAIAEIKLLHHSHLLQQMNRSIDGGQVTLALR